MYSIIRIVRIVTYSFVAYVDSTLFIQDAQLAQRDRAARYAGFGQKWKTETGRQYFKDNIGLPLTTVA